MSRSTPEASKPEDRSTTFSFVAIAVSICSLALAPALAQGCCNTPGKVDYYNAGPDMGEALGVTGRFTEADREQPAHALAAMTNAVKESLARHGVAGCVQPERDVINGGPAVGAPWSLTINGRAPDHWSAALQCGGGSRVEVTLKATPYALPNLEDRDRAIDASGVNFIHLHESRRRVMEIPDILNPEPSGDTQWLVVGEIGSQAIDVHGRVPSWARPHTLMIRVSPCGMDLLTLLDVSVLATLLTRLPEGSPLPRPPRDPPTHLSMLERHRLERAAYAAILPESPYRPTNVSTELIVYDPAAGWFLGDVRIFEHADLGLPSSLAADFVIQTGTRAPFPRTAALGGRHLIDEKTWDATTGPLLRLSAVGFSADHTHAMLIAEARYDQGRSVTDLIVLRWVRGGWEIQYVRGYGIC